MTDSLLAGGAVGVQARGPGDAKRCAPRGDRNSGTQAVCAMAHRLFIAIC